MLGKDPELNDALPRFIIVWPQIDFLNEFINLLELTPEKIEIFKKTHAASCMSADRLILIFYARAVKK
jgi:hypothetical protein